MKYPTIQRTELLDALTFYNELAVMEMLCDVPRDNKTIETVGHWKVPQKTATPSILKAQYDFLSDRLKQRHLFTEKQKADLATELESKEAVWRTWSKEELLEQSGLITAYRNCQEILCNKVSPELLFVLDGRRNPLDWVYENVDEITDNATTNLLRENERGLPEFAISDYDASNPYIPLKISDWTPIYDRDVCSDDIQPNESEMEME